MLPLLLNPLLLGKAECEAESEEFRDRCVVDGFDVAAAAAATIPSRPGSAAGGDHEREQAQKTQPISAVSQSGSVTHRCVFIRFCLEFGHSCSY